MLMEKKNNIKISQEEVNLEIEKQFKMMPGQEKMIKEYYEQNPSAIDGIRGSIYEEKIINQIKKDAKVVKKEISKEEAEKILKEENEKNIKEQEKLSQHSHEHNHDHDHKVEKKSVSSKKKVAKKAKPDVKKIKSVKKVSNK